MSRGMRTLTKTVSPRAFMSRVAPAAAAILCSTLFATTAEARRVAIDLSDPDNPMYTPLGGYCDLNGDDCSPYGLPFPITFSSGVATGVRIHGNGSFDFTSASSEVLASVFAGENNRTTLDEFGDSVYKQAATIDFFGSGFAVNWFTCETPKNCYTEPYYAQIGYGTDGLDLFIDYDTSLGFFGDSIQKGWAITGGDSNLKTQTLFFPHLGLTFAPETLSTFIPAQFVVPGDPPTPPGVPEPGTWALMLLGFGALGAAVRRRRRVAAVHG